MSLARVVRSTSSLSSKLSSLRERIELSDPLVFLYLLVVVRQYFWIVDNNVLGWALSATFALVGIYLYVRTKPFAATQPGWEFWLIVATPLLFFYLLRLPFPDLSYDVLNYRLVHGERSLYGPLFAAGDFFPTPAPYNPMPDTLTALFRLALGYRLGTVINFFALLWTALVVEKILRLFIDQRVVRAAFVLLVVLAEHLLFEINNYMVDLLALPLLMESTYLTVRLIGGEADNASSDEPSAVTASTTNTVYIHVALLSGLAIALKLSNAIIVAPLVVILIATSVFGLYRPKRKLLTLLFALLALAAPVAPFTVYLWRITGNPVFPLANKLFKSPFWVTTGAWDARWGPLTSLQAVIWPILTVVHPERHSELAVYSGRLSVGFVAALIALAVAWRYRTIRLLSLLFLIGCVLWTLGALGYSRYGLYLEVLGGIVIVTLVVTLIREAATRFSWKSICAAVFAISLVIQTLFACSYALSHEWSMRPTFLTNSRLYKTEARYLFRDRSLLQFQPEQQREVFSNVDLWIVSGVKTSGLEVLLNRRAGMIGIIYLEYLTTRRSLKQLVQTIERTPNGRIYSLCLPEDLSFAKEFIGRRGLEISKVNYLTIPFFSSTTQPHMMLIAISLPQDAKKRADFENSWAKAPFVDEDYRAAITTDSPIATLRTGERATIHLRVRNLGHEVWPSHGDAQGMFQVNIGDRWLDSTGSHVVNDLDVRSALPADLDPGKEVELSLNVRAPQQPGDYILEIDMIHEGVTFFYEKGSSTLRMRVHVEPAT